MNKIYEKFNIPTSCLLENTIFKKSFIENADLTISDKKILNDIIKKVIWKYCLKPETINIQPYKDTEREYLEIEVIEVNILEKIKVAKISELIFKTIPYPILLVLVCGKEFQIATGDIRKSLNDSSKMTVDNFAYSDWIDASNTDELANNFLSSLSVNQLKTTDYYRLYLDITDKINLYNISKIKGNSSVAITETDSQQLYEELRDTEDKINQLQNQAIKALAVSEKVEISIELNKLRIKKEELLKKNIKNGMY